MKNAIFLFIFLIAVSSVIAQPHYLIGASSEDKSVISGAISRLKNEGFIASDDYLQMLDYKLDKEELDNRVVLVLYEKKAAVIVGESCPATDVILAGEIGKYVKAKGYDLMPAMTSDEIKYNDLSLLFKSVECKDSDGRDHSIKGSAVGYDETGEKVTLWDSCTGNVLLEKYCEDGLVKTEYFECDECKDGKCIEVEEQEDEEEQEEFEQEIAEKEQIVEEQKQVEEKEESDVQPIQKEKKESNNFFAAIIEWFKNLF